MGIYRKPLVNGWEDLVRNTLGIESRSNRLRVRILNCWNNLDLNDWETEFVISLIRKIEDRHFQLTAKQKQKLTKIESEGKKNLQNSL